MGTSTTTAIQTVLSRLPNRGVRAISTILATVSAATEAKPIHDLYGDMSAVFLDFIAEHPILIQRPIVVTPSAMSASSSARLAQTVWPASRR